MPIDDSPSRLSLRSCCVFSSRGVLPSLHMGGCSNRKAKAISIHSTGAEIHWRTLILGSLSHRRCSVPRLASSTPLPNTGLQRCPEPEDFFLPITSEIVMTKLCKTALNSCCLHFQEAYFLGVAGRGGGEGDSGSGQELCGFRHKV